MTPPRTPVPSRVISRWRSFFGATPAGCRVIWLGVILLAGLVFATWRLGALGVRDHVYYQSQAHAQRNLQRSLSSERGEIFFQDRFGNLAPAALNRETWAVIAAPNKVGDAAGAARLLAPILNAAPEQIAAKLNDKNDSYEPIGQGVAEEVKDAIETLGIAGIHFSRATARSYPAGEDAAAVTGFFGFREGSPAGQYGVEEFFEAELKGLAGSVSGERDTLGRIIFSALTELAPARRGSDLVLTVDPNVQSRVARVLKESVQRWQAASASAIVLEPKTGNIRAMAAWPAYDPNAYEKVGDASLFINPLVQQRFEPGSVFKPFAMAAALEEHALTPDTTYEDPGKVAFGSYTISNFDNQSHGVQTMTQVLEKSLNTGAIFAMQQAGKEEFLEMIKAFGFGEKTGVEIADEVAGDTRALETLAIFSSQRPPSARVSP